ncbi:NAD(P)/FAD-dependent oxidoreductase [Flavobacteriaceae bacterium S0825]|uniref:NAD(P)/FAD-dependent oxidoreductase n=1 Tax=Gaetbulibacter sp. S0825 TaxID=2720084 RepID=UPI00142FDD33|nr:NAD(P)/FAD-dependent oxidoreductase [Gaetbulibacter sp. S0825]MCK0107796.1 NAD(P)/FAD-dependent oxidoreductase [Flavobacteriaceae bacterium S0825]NIX63432.1 NAD(P)/FAD-dependent oxidoreductase [Gaetbulibacter sp. S0825]
MNQYNVIIIGGGAAGFFAAINIAQQNPNLKVAILERGKEGLQKVRISGGGRCNVTHAEFVPSELVQNYPRGEKELLGPFHQFITGDTIEWFEKRGVELKIEEDGRMFPITDSSQTIIDCFLNEAKNHHVEILYNHSVKSIKKGEISWKIETSQGDFTTKKLLIATGSNAKIWKLLEGLGHTIIKPVPSLFTFDIKDERINDIPGVVARNVEIRVLQTNLWSEGPLLITHVGMSAPAILKLSAFGALELAKLDYKFKIEVNFIKQSLEDCLDTLKEFKQEFAKKTVYKSTQFELPKRLWHKLVLASNINRETRWADLNKGQLENLASQLTQAVFSVDGKSTFKEEFVTAGGVNLKEINFRTFESKLHNNLYFAGEVINVDAVTGGFNFQNAWTGAYIAAKAMSK